MSKTLVLLSGGADSATALGMFVKDFGSENVSGLNVHYGQKHSREIQAAKDIANYYKINLHEIDLSPIFESSNCSLLQHSTINIPQQTYAEQLKTTGGTPVTTYVPYRNGLFLSVAASMALSLGCNILVYGAHADDAAGNAYPDCSIKFTQALSTAIYLGSGQQLQAFAPFVSMTKAQLIKLGLDIGVPYELTWSCYEGKEKPCGVCGTCRDRIKAFEENGAVDPLKY